MSKIHGQGPVPPGMNGGPPPAAPPPSYAQAVGGVQPPHPYQQRPHVPGEPIILTTVVPLGPNTTHMICPFCMAEIDTSVKIEPGLVAYLSSCLIALLGCWFGCCLIPCCIDECMDKKHFCPNCNGYLGKYAR